MLQFYSITNRNKIFSLLHSRLKYIREHQYELKADLYMD